MKKLDWYILKKYIITFFFLVLLFLIIILMIDFSDHNDDFIKKQVPWDEVIFDYYANLIPWLANFLSPLLVFISTIFVTGRMAQHTELIAVLSAGVSFRRILVSFSIGALLLGGLTFWMLGWVIPRSNADRVAFELEYFSSDNGKVERNVHIMINPEQKAYMRNFVAQTNTGIDFCLETFEGLELVHQLKAKRIKWDTTRSVWHMRQCKVREFKEGEELVYYRKDVDTTFGLEPKDWVKVEKLSSTLTIPELRAHIKSMEVRGTMSVESLWIDYYERFTYPLAIVVLTMIGVVSAGKKSREGVVWRIIVGFILCFVYWVILQLGRSFAQDQTIHPLVSSLIPNVVFAFLGWFLYRKLPK